MFQASPRRHLSSSTGACWFVVGKPCNRYVSGLPADIHCVSKSQKVRFVYRVLGCEGKSVELLALFTIRFGAKSSTDLPLMPCTLVDNWKSPVGFCLCWLRVRAQGPVDCFSIATTGREAGRAIGGTGTPPARHQSRLVPFGKLGNLQPLPAELGPLPLNSYLGTVLEYSTYVLYVPQAIAALTPCGTYKT